MQTESSGAQSEEEEERAGKEASRSCSSTRGQHWHRVGFAKSISNGGFNLVSNLMCHCIILILALEESILI
jgi:hypothetical protein